ncbi:MAG: integration host factor subunit alpha [Rickettsiales bacterium]|nr:integration host factor subunit alpha [Rickettsiales bacterium]
MVNTVTRATLAEAVYRELGFSLTECSEMVDSMLEELITGLERGETVKLSSFGTFGIRHKKERIGRNPKTKEEIPITPRNVISFRASNILMKRVNDTVE